VRPLLRSTIRILASLTFIGVIILVYFKFVTVNPTTVALTLLLAVLGIAAQWGLTESIVASLAAMLGFNYFFLPPTGTFEIADSQNWVALIAFLVTAFTASQLSIRARRRTAEADARRREVERLYALGQTMLMSGSVRTTARDTVNSIMRTFEIPGAILFSKAENEFFRSDRETLAISDEQLRWIASSDEPLIDRQRQIAITPIRLGGQVLGSLGFIGCTMSTAALNAVTYLVAIGIERARSLEEGSKTEALRQSEALKAALLDALAHDLKTPLTSTPRKKNCSPSPTRRLIVSTNWWSKFSRWRGSKPPSSIRTGLRTLSARSFPPRFMRRRSRSKAGVSSYTLPSRCLRRMSISNSSSRC